MIQKMNDEILKGHFLPPSIQSSGHVHSMTTRQKLTLNLTISPDSPKSTSTSTSKSTAHTPSNAYANPNPNTPILGSGRRRLVLLRSARGKSKGKGNATIPRSKTDTSISYSALASTTSLSGSESGSESESASASASGTGSFDYVTKTPTLQYRTQLRSSFSTDIVALCPCCHELKSDFVCLSCISADLAKFRGKISVIDEKKADVEDAVGIASRPVLLHGQQERKRKRANLKIQILKQKLELEKQRVQRMREQIEAERLALEEKTRAVTVKQNELRQTFQERYSLMRPLLDSLTLTHSNLTKDVANTRRTLIYRLLSILPLNPVSGDESCIVNIVLPNSISTYTKIMPKELVSTALGYTCHLIDLISRYGSLYVPFPVVYTGSESTIRRRDDGGGDGHVNDVEQDNWHIVCSPKSPKFELALKMLCLNCVTMGKQCGLSFSDGDMRGNAHSRKNGVKLNARFKDELLVNVLACARSPVMIGGQGVGESGPSAAAEGDGGNDGGDEGEAQGVAEGEESEWHVVLRPPPPLPSEPQALQDDWHDVFGEKHHQYDEMSVTENQRTETNDKSVVQSHSRFHNHGHNRSTDIDVESLPTLPPDDEW